MAFYRPKGHSWHFSIDEKKKKKRTASKAIDERKNSIKAIDERKNSIKAIDERKDVILFKGI